jgi:hypothetical protein
MRTAFALALLAGVAPVGLAQNPPTPAPRLAFEATGADTVTCNGVRLHFQAFRDDPHGGVGFVVRVLNVGTEPRPFDATKFRAELPNGRRVTFLSAREVAEQFFLTGAGRAYDADRRTIEQRDIEADPMFLSGPVRPWMPVVKFLALGWSRVTSGPLASYLPIGLTCDRQNLGRINFVGDGS